MTLQHPHPRSTLQNTHRHHWFHWRIAVHYALLCVLLVNLTPHAQEQKLLISLANIAQNPILAQRVRQIFEFDEKRLTPSCTQPIPSAEPAEIHVFQNPEIDDTGTPQSGFWAITFAVDICGTEKLRTIAYEVRDQKLNIYSLIPGNTQADPQLQKDVYKAFGLAVGQGFPDCKDGYFIADTRVLQMPPNGSAPWEELWVANVCGNLFGQAIRFVPTQDGTAFKMDIASR